MVEGCLRSEDKRPRKRMAKCTNCGKLHEIDNPLEWEYANVALKDMVCCDCGHDTFRIFEVFDE